jgi:hypothetical protein
MIKRYISAVGVSAVLHGLAAVGAVWLAFEPGAPRQPHSEPMRAFVIAPTEDAAFPGVKPLDRAAAEWSLEGVGQFEPVSIGKFNADPGKIAMRAHVLFPFVSPGLALEHFFPMMRQDGHRLGNPLVAAPARRSNPTNQPLLLKGSELQAIVDKSWSRYERWKGFEKIRTLTEVHSGDEGHLPTVLGKYCDENALQPYADSVTRDPRLWVQLGIASDHITFIGFIRQYVAEHPSTKASIELLFLLDTLAQASRDTLGVLLDTAPAELLTWTRQTDPKAYRLIARIREHYSAELVRRGLTSKSAIEAHYDSVRLAILRGILASARDGYRLNDARFLIGAIHWRAERPNEALQSWRELTERADGSHTVASSQIRHLLRQRPTPEGVMWREVERILRNDQGRWLMSSYDRLERFGYRVDTY